MFAAQAQLTEGEPHSTKIKTGNRPLAGDWGMYIGPSYTDIRSLIEWADKSKSVDVVRGLPLLNVKYYASDNFELRCGLQYFNVVNKYSGTTYPLKESVEGKYSNAFFRIIPGLAYHFTSKNVLDVYIGGQLPIGFDIDKDIQETGVIVNNTKRNSFVVGIGVFGGLQVFVADLPFSIGLEVGLTGLAKCGQKVKHEVSDENNNIQTFYTTLDDETLTYSKLNCHTFEMGSDFRLTFTYYFNNKK